MIQRRMRLRSKKRSDDYSLRMKAIVLETDTVCFVKIIITKKELLFYFLKRISKISKCWHCKFKYAYGLLNHLVYQVLLRFISYGSLAIAVIGEF